jgi:hypothetical protein
MVRALRADLKRLVVFSPSPGWQLIWTGAPRMLSGFLRLGHPAPETE